MEVAGSLVWRRARSEGFTLRIHSWEGWLGSNCMLPKFEGRSNSKGMGEGMQFKFIQVTIAGILSILVNGYKQYS